MDFLEIMRRIARERPELDYEEQMHTLAWPPEKVGKPFTNVSLLNEPDYFSDDCIFDECSDDEKRFVLEFFLSGEPVEIQPAWGVSLELSKLLAKNGNLIPEAAKAAVDRAIENHYCQLFFSYSALMGGGDDLAIRMLDVVSDDLRDGLFLGCYRLKSEKVWRKLEQCLLEWSSTPGWGSGTGEIYALRKFIERWEQVGFPFDSRLKDYVLEYYRNIGKVPPPI